MTNLSAQEEHRRELLAIFQTDRVAAHKFLFPHRHKDATPEFHEDIITLFNDPHPLVALEAFRGGAKSTIAEEDVLIEALFQDFEFCLLIGNNYGSACQRLAAIKNELISNDAILQLFGDQVSSPWSEDVIVLANGRKIQAMGAGQSMRGVKHFDARPDRAYIDDLEDEESVATDEARIKTKRWLNSVLRPALNPKTGKIRMIGTPLHPKALIVEKMSDPAWKSKKFPICYLDENGVEQATWPARFSMGFIAQLRLDYAKDGNLTEFEQEYMCRAEDAAAKPFQQSMIHVVPQPPVWMPTKIFIDPARTVNVKRSARTGYAVWAWVGNKLKVFEGFGHFHKPDEIIDEIFRLDAKYNPVEIGVERDGLELFLLQPLQQAQLDRGIVLPIVPMKAPRDKISFITSLQPFYKAGDVEHAKQMPDLEMELLQFPTGRVDVPNALAYAQRMRAGRVVYEDFTAKHIAAELRPNTRHPGWMVFNARPSVTTAALVQYVDGVIRIYKDWMLHKPPLEAVTDIIQEAVMVGGIKFKCVAPAEEFEQYANNGVVAAIRRANYQAQRGAFAKSAEGKCAAWLRKQVRGQAGFLVDQSCRWVVNGMADGYCRKLNSSGMLDEFTAENPYRWVMEAIESFVAWFDVMQQVDESANERHYAVSPDGRRYLSSRV